MATARSRLMGGQTARTACGAPRIAEKCGVRTKLWPKLVTDYCAYESHEVVRRLAHDPQRLLAGDVLPDLAHDEPDVLLVPFEQLFDGLWRLSQVGRLFPHRGHDDVWCEAQQFTYETRAD